jgi:hypothetical protein
MGWDVDGLSSLAPGDPYAQLKNEILNITVDTENWIEQITPPPENLEDAKNSYIVLERKPLNIMKNNML